MRILMLFPYAPLPPPRDLAGTKRNLPFLLELSKYNDVSVLSYGSQEEQRLFRDTYNGIFKEIRFVNNKRHRLINGLEKLLLLATGRSIFRQIYRQSMQIAIDEMTSTSGYDIIHSCTQFFGYFRFPEGIPVSSDTHEVKFDLFRRTAENTNNPLWKCFYYLAYRFGKQEEIRLCKQFNLLITTTQPDLALFRRDLPDQTILSIQNGAGYSFFEPIHIAPEPWSIVFTGLFTHRPNSDGIIYFLKNVFPLILRDIPQAHLYVVGKSPPPELLAMRSDNVTVTGFVEDVRPYMAKSRVFVIPLLAGGGIRGKALEAMAMKLPIVTTTVGVEGIELHHEQSALFADTAEKFALAVTRLLKDSNLHHTLAQNAYQTALRQYDWETKGKELNHALKSTAFQQKHLLKTTARC